MTTTNCINPASKASTIAFITETLTKIGAKVQQINFRFKHSVQFCCDDSEGYIWVGYVTRERNGALSERCRINFADDIAKGALCYHASRARDIHGNPQRR